MKVRRGLKLVQLVRQALAAERDLDRMILDPDDADRLTRADADARLAVIRAMRRPGEPADADSAAILPDGTIVAVCSQADGLAIIPPSRIRRIGGVK